MFYIIAFVIAMALTIYVVYEPIEKKESTTNSFEKDEVKPENENPELTEFLRKHLYYGTGIEFKSIQDSKTGYYYESGNYSITYFDYPGYVTAQFFQMTPYVQLADMRVNKNDSQSLEVNLKNAPEDTHQMIHQIFVKVKTENVKAYYENASAVKAVAPKLETEKTSQPLQWNVQIESGLMRINALIEAMGKESQTLSMEVKHNMRSIVVVDLPNLMNKYKTIKKQDSSAEKEKINDGLKQIENYLNKEWNLLLDRKRHDKSGYLDLQNTF